VGGREIGPRGAWTNAYRLHVFDTGSAGDGLLLYSATAQANGTDGDQLVIGPPFVIADAEIERIASGTAAAIRSVREER
jgi:adenosylmethionine-8-amino-7-oxononanoate aminotransferase